MPAPATFETFEPALRDLVARFSAGASGFLSRDYAEASVRQDFLDPFFTALGWDLKNERQLILNKREVEIESRTMIDGRKKRADYLFRIDGTDRFVCEAKKPAEVLNSDHAFQAKRYARNKVLPLALLTDFEGLCLYVVAVKPRRSDPADAGLWKKWHYTEYPAHARELWDLLSREAVAGGALDRELDKLPKSPSGKGRARQLWLIRPDRTRAIDAEFLAFLDESRRTLGSDLLRHNPTAGLRDDLPRLNEAVQRILDRLLFLRICEDRDIDTGLVLNRAVENFLHATGDPRARRATQPELRGVVNEPPTGQPNLSTHQLWPALVTHFQRLDRRPASPVPFFNGHLFKPHFTEELQVGDAWLTDFLNDLGGDDSEYLFNIIPVEILGTIYERFLGKVIRPQGLGVTIEEKPEVRKAGGVYYTPQYIVHYIVEQTVGKLLDSQPPEKTLALRFLDPACGSGSFLIRVFERVCEHWQAWLLAHPKARKKNLCWIEDATGDVHLTAALKRRILTANIYGVDLDPGAVEVTQLSLYLKMLEHENRNTLARERELFAEEDEPALLPPLAANIKCGNSLIASDFSLDPDELVRVRAFDWDVQFAAIMKTGGFDAVVGNPPYVQIENIPTEDRSYFVSVYGENGKLGKRYDLYQVFVMRAIRLLRAKARLGYILPNTFLMGHSYSLLRKRLVGLGLIHELVDLPQGVFLGVVVDNVLLFFERQESAPMRAAYRIAVNKLQPKSDKSRVAKRDWDESFEIRQSALSAESEWKINVHTNPRQAQFFEKVERSGKRLGNETESSQGIILYRTEDEADEAKYTGFQPKKGWKHLLRGKNIGRYETIWGGEFVSYGEWLWCARDERFFNQPKLLLHAMRNKSLARRLVATYDEDLHYNAHNLGNIVSKSGSAFALKFILGIFNSALINYWYRSHFPNVNINPSDFRQIPLPALNLGRPTDRARHDRLVTLVDKMLTFVPKLRAATADHERATLQNAVTATDNQIDQLVYELYALTPEEIALVERAGNSAPAPQAD